MSRHSLVVGNWKMNGNRRSSVELIQTVAEGIEGLSGIDVAVSVPFTLMETCQRELHGTPIALAGQNLSECSNGAHTGEISAEMLKEFDCAYVIVGHSERRADQGESDLVVAAKTRSALQAGMTPVICVGETLQEREAGRAQEIILSQIDAALDKLDSGQRSRCVLAYEPVWAIGTGRTATPEQASEVHSAIRSRLRTGDAASADTIRILYGGSVKASNARQLFLQPDIDGGLIGGASLSASEFVAIVQAACGGVLR
jgi:triosephosphate isomerase